MKGSNIHAILESRRPLYGDFADKAGFLQKLKQLLRTTPQWGQLTADKQEALEMVLTKMGRILYGKPEYRDSWEDIAGYVQLIVDTLPAADPHNPNTPQNKPCTQRFHGEVS